MAVLSPRHRSTAASPSAWDASDELRCCVGAAPRLVAFALDAVLLGIVLVVLAAAHAAVFGAPTSLGGGGAPTASAIVETVLAAGVSAGYFAGLWRLFGATPGQWLLGMRVRAVEGGALPMSRCLVRWVALGAPLWFGPAVALRWPLFGAALSMLALLWFSVLGLTIVRDPRRRGLHDRLAATGVSAPAVVAPWDAGRHEASSRA